jgi:hypothetical protein
MANPIPGGATAQLLIGGRKGWDADHHSVQIDQAAAAVARIDRGAGLHRVGENNTVAFADRAALETDDPLRDRAGQSNRVP